MDSNITIDLSKILELYDSYKVLIFSVGAIIGLYISYKINKKFKISNLLWSSIRLINFKKLGFDTKTGAIITCLTSGFLLGFTSVEWENYVSKNEIHQLSAPPSTETIRDDLIKHQKPYSLSQTNIIDPPKILLEEITKLNKQEYEANKIEYNKKIEAAKHEKCGKRFLSPQVAIGLWGVGIVLALTGLLLVARNFF